MNFNEPNVEHRPTVVGKKLIFDLDFKKSEGRDKRLIVLGCDNLPGNELACIEEQDAPLFLANDMKLQIYATAIENNLAESLSLDPLDFELVIVKAESISRWLRAAIVAKHFNKFLVHAIDYGISYLADKKDIRRWSMEIDYSILTLTCAVNGLDQEKKGALFAQTKEITAKSIVFDVARRLHSIDIDLA